MKEIWKQVVGYEGLYEVSNLGRVKAPTKLSMNGRVLKAKNISQTSNGQCKMVKLRKSGNRVTHQVHRLVYEAFIGPIPPYKLIRHIDGNFENNHPINLVVGTDQDNSNDHKVHCRMDSTKQYGTAKITEQDVRDIRKLRNSGKHLDVIALRYKLSISQVQRIASRQRWSHVK